VGAVSLAVDENKVPYLLVQGENLAVDPRFKPVAVVNQTLAEVMSSSDKEIKLQLTGEHALSENNELILTFDPFAVVKVNVTAKRGAL
jgi:hypothetical protein